MDTFNLTLPLVTHTNTRWLDSEQTKTHGIQAKARREVLVGLLAAISPELSTLETAPSWGAEAVFPFGLSVSLTVSFIANGYIEVVVKRSWRRDTFKRFKVTGGALDPRVVEGVRELVARAKEVAQWEVEGREKAAADAATKLARFAVAQQIVAANRAEWSFGAPREGSTSGSLNVPTGSIQIDGGTLKLEVSAPIELLPEVLAFLKGVKQSTVAP